MKKLFSETPESHVDSIAVSVERLRKLFPGVWRDEKLDTDALRQLLGEAVEDGDEKFGLSWRGKRRARQMGLRPSSGALVPRPDESVDWETTQNVFIEGDNLEVLRLLRKAYASSAKVIYIDPPYNTGKDFVYPDDYQNSLANYLELTGQTEAGRRTTSNVQASGRFHTDWLTMMYPRLMVAHELLRDDGVLFVSIDDVELANLRSVLDELFGEENRLGCLILETATDNNPTQIAVEHEYMLVYAKDADEQEEWGRPSENAKLIQKKYDALKVELGEDVDAIQTSLREWIRENRGQLDGVTHYDNVDRKGVFHDGDVANTKMGGYAYDVPHNVTGRACRIPEKGYRFPEETMKRMLAADDILFGEDETVLIKPKKRIENARELLRSVIYEDGRAATKRLNDLLARGVFNNPKSELLLDRLLDFTSKKGDLVIDFFAGSGTTGHAAMRHGARGSERRFLLVQLPQPLDIDDRDQRAAATFCDVLGKPRTIAELTKERLRRTDALLRQQHPPAAHVLGFRVFRLATSAIHPWNARPSDLERALLEAVEQIDPTRSEFEVAFELLLKRGFLLSAQLESREIAGKTVYRSGEGALFICLAQRIDPADVVALSNGILEWHVAGDSRGETMVVFRDSAFADDAVKADMAALLDQGGLTHVRSV